MTTPPSMSGSAANMFAMRELNAIDARARSAAAHISCATSIRGALQAAHLIVPGWARGVSRTLGGLRQMQHALDQKLAKLVQGQLNEVQSLPQAQQVEALLKLEREDWQLLRKEHAQVLHVALREATMIKLKASKARKS